MKLSIMAPATRGADLAIGAGRRVWAPGRGQTDSCARLEAAGTMFRLPSFRWDAREIPVWPMIFVVLEEVYSLAPDGQQLELKGRSPRPLFAGDRRAAYSFAKEQAAQFDAADYHEDRPDPYFSGRDVEKCELHRFIIKPAMPG